MKKLMIFTIAFTLPFISDGKPPKEGAFSQAGMHAGEPAAERICSSVDNAVDKLDKSVDKLCTTIDKSVETTNQTFIDLPGDVQATMIVAGAVAGVFYVAHSASWYAYHYANGTLEAELEKNRLAAEESRRKIEEERLKAFIASQEAARLKRNAEIETEFNSCFANRFHSPTRKRNGIPSSCELQGMQLVSTGKFKSMQDLKEYYKS